MVFQKGQPGSLKGGRKTKAEEVARTIELLKEEITNEALLKLARSKVFKQIVENEDRETAKDFALPVALRGITEKIDTKISGKITIELSPDIAAKNNLNATDDSPPSTITDS